MYQSHYHYCFVFAGVMLLPLFLLLLLLFMLSLFCFSLHNSQQIIAKCKLHFFISQLFSIQRGGLVIVVRGKGVKHFTTQKYTTWFHLFMSFYYHCIDHKVYHFLCYPFSHVKLNKVVQLFPLNANFVLFIKMTSKYAIHK